MARMSRSARNRAAARTRTVPSGTVVSRNGTLGTDPSIRPTQHAAAPGPVKRTRCAPMTAAMRSGDGSGRVSAWAASPEFFTDPRWSQTVGNRNV